MIQPGLPIVLMGVGFAFVNLGFWSMYVELMRRKALGSWGSSFSRLIESFTRIETPRDRLVFRGGPAAVLLGAVCCFSGVGISDARTNRPCVQGCEAAGHTGGRVRGDPFASQVTVAGCWCYDGTRTKPEWVRQSVEQS